MVDNVREILQRSLAGDEISRNECLRLMEIEHYSPEIYELSSVANRLTRDTSNGLGEVHAQVGIDYTQCAKKCRFCVFGNVASEHLELSEEEVVARAKEFARAPHTAPRLSIARRKPKLPPLFSLVEMSAMIASLGAHLILPAMSRILKGTSCCQIVENA